MFLLPRHGIAAAHRPAHQVEHRAHLDALARCRVDRVISVHSVGALDAELAAGALAVDDFLDMRARKPSFYDDAAVHVDVSEPYCPDVRRALLAAGAVSCGPYVSTEGPRLETRAEVRALARLAGPRAVVGMTGATEASLARERALCFASLCMITNPAAGVGGARPSAEEIKRVARDMAPRALALALDAASRVSSAKGCGCSRALDAARL